MKSLLPPQPPREALIEALCRPKATITDPSDAVNMIHMYTRAEPDRYAVYNEEIHANQVERIIWHFTNTAAYITGPFDRFHTNNPINICEYNWQKDTAKRIYRGLQWSNGFVLVIREHSLGCDGLWADREPILLCFIDTETCTRHRYLAPRSPV